jgi:hypothetical protein
VPESSHPESRKHPRIEIRGHHPLNVDLDGNVHTMLVADISEGGIGFLSDQQTDVSPNDVMAIGIEQVVNLRGRVRWVAHDPAQPQKTRVGVEFQSVIVHPKRTDEVQEMVDAWMKISHSYNTFDSFLRILDIVDNDILDGKIVDFTDAVSGIAMWMEQSVGDLDLWHVIEGPDGSPDVHLMVELGSEGRESFDDRAERVAAVARGKVTKWFEHRPYIYGENIVIEFFGNYEGKIDLLHKLAILLGKRTRTWTKLLSKNIALQVLSEQISRQRGLDDL